MADKHNIPKGNMHSNCRLLPDHIVCKITQRNNIRRANPCDQALKLLNEVITSDIQKQNLWKEHLDAHWDYRHNTHNLWKTIHCVSNSPPPPTSVVKEDVLTHLLSDTTNGPDVIYIPQAGSSVDDLVQPVPTTHSLPKNFIPLEDSESENRDNPTPLPQVPEESIAGPMLNDATKTSTSPIISEHFEIAADDHIERESPAK